MPLQKELQRDCCFLVVVLALVVEALDDACSKTFLYPVPYIFLMRLVAVVAFPCAVPDTFVLIIAVFVASVPDAADDACDVDEVAETVFWC
jgi:hypothetical protein